MNNLSIKETIKSMIHDIRGVKVLLDSDIAKIYNYETKYINRVVKRNIERFPKEFYFKVTKNEFETLRCQFVTLNENKRGQHKKYLPYAFTKDGVITLATILKSEKIREITSIVLEAFNDLNNNQIILKSPGIQGNITSKIYEIRGKQVMLDSDLASLYQVETKRINEAVKNNPEKFPKRFSWKLTKEECLNLRSKFSTSSWNNYGGRRYDLQVFTEQGVAMLATILKSKVATKVSIAIMDAFVSMHHLLLDNQNIYEELGYHSRKLIKHEEKLNKLFSKFENQEPKELVYFNGQIYDAYSKIIDIISSAKKELIIIDNYADKTFLDMISKVTTPTKLIIKTKGILKELDIQKYQEQYSNLEVIRSDIFHDRYIIIDETTIYHCGTSLNKAGSRVFSINKLEEKEIKEALIIKIKKELEENKKTSSEVI